MTDRKNIEKQLDRVTAKWERIVQELKKVYRACEGLDVTLIQSWSDWDTLLLNGWSNYIKIYERETETGPQLYVLVGFGLGEETVHAPLDSDQGREAIRNVIMVAKEKSNQKLQVEGPFMPGETLLP